MAFDPWGRTIQATQNLTENLAGIQRQNTADREMTRREALQDLQMEEARMKIGEMHRSLTNQEKLRKKLADLQNTTTTTTQPAQPSPEQGERPANGPAAKPIGAPRDF